MGLLFMTSIGWSQKTAELISYSRNEKNEIENKTSVIRLLLSDELALNTQEKLSEFEKTNNTNIRLTLSENQLVISGSKEYYSGEVYANLFKYLGIETLLFRNGNEITELSIESYLQKISN